MRVLKTIFIIVLALVALLLIRGLFGAKTFRIERSTVIAAPAEAVFPKIASLKTMYDWSPWKEKDPNAKTTMEGTDGAVGSSMSWEGNKDVGSGKQEVTELVPNKSMRMALHFIKPWEANNTATFDLAPAGDSTKVTWGLEGENGFMMRVMSVFMDMDKMVGPDFEKGLANLKAMAEAEQAEAAKAKAAEPVVAIQTGDRPAATYVGIKSDPKLPWAAMEKFFMDNSSKLYETLGKANVKPAGPMCGLYYDWNEKEMTTSMMVCVPVAEGTKVKGLETEKMPATRAYWTVLNGPYGGMKAAHEALGARIEADSLDHGGPVLEEYVAGPGTETDSTKYVTNIIYPVKARK